MRSAKGDHAKGVRTGPRGANRVAVKKKGEDASKGGKKKKGCS